ncbi:50S ribosomal protein L23 [Candidatus Fokinia crypta]|uniref:Large ribosomal subunit protein uL23 n=1 Tax=Candidatus Fokinia crypta TaxID=1920990 RepID=A0ABZ0UQM4_9RICK|nr:50S ribosomal protein L23 [Candidatus Fokinia cryptica]WPX97972.1 50S ribosomal protein L23 [Candidatus Fokinia cryptica]
MPINSLYDVIKSVRFSEKTELLKNMKVSSKTGEKDKRKYTFVVSKDATKLLVQKAVEKFLNASVDKVNIINVKPSVRVFRGRKGVVSGYKKAVVTLKEGEQLPELSS